MPEYVYALHDFAPEHEDEIAFNAGDRIEVIEKDDMYGDGWWQGRNLFGKVGLFPQSYTTTDQSVLQPQTAPQTIGTSSVPANQLQALAEESDVESKKDEAAVGNGAGVMRATLTDVQQAIEQLGRSGIDRDGGGSFSFASTRDGDTTDRELDTDRETDNEQAEESANGWHKGGRSGLAEKARLQQQKQLEQEAALEAAALSIPMVSAPPIEFELSDESEAEEEEDMRFPHRDHARIPEEDEEDEAPARQTNGHIVDPQSKQADPSAIVNDTQQSTANFISSEEFTVPEPDETEAQTATARQVSFPTEALPSPTKPHPDAVSTTVQAPTPSHLQPTTLLTPTSPTSLVAAQSTAQLTRNEVSPPLVRPASHSELKKPMSPQNLPSPPQSQNGSKVPTTSPSEWSVEEVVEWAKSRGLDNSVSDKFIEHEISGDVLIELDEQILKTELEIHAFGKRKRIMKEIELLRRPPSISSSVQRVPSQGHSHSFSQSISLPGSAQQSLHSPMGNILSPESPPHTGDISASPAATSTLRRDSDPGSSFRVSITDQESTANNSMVGLGIGAAASVLASSTVGSVDKFEPSKGQKNRPAHLNLSPSDNALSVRSKTTNFSPKRLDSDVVQDERAAMSDTESTRALDSRSKRRRMFGRSTGSTHSDSKDTLGRTSTPTSVPGSPSTKRESIEDGKATQRRKRSVDASRTHDRLSLFGGSISIGRGRKPPPRPQSYANDDLATEKSSRSLSRLMLSGGSRKASTRSHASELNGFKEESSPGVLRKRTTSLMESSSGVSASGLKPGQSVLEQIGQPDHNGWMMKKGERYNTWKLRYFVLKGPHLYYLESNSKALTKIKGYINITGYKVIVDENVNPGRYGFRLIHDTEKTHYFSSDEQIIVREWMKALMKATIGRDYTKPVISSCNIPTIPLAVAQTMNPAPRPPSPSQRDATQKALRRENPNQLSTRDARVLMGLPSAHNQQESEQMHNGGTYATAEQLPGIQENGNGERSPAPSSIVTSAPPVRPSRETRRTSVPTVDGPFAPLDLIQWANDHLPQQLRISETNGQVFSALALYRLGEAVKGRATEPAVPDSAFPSGPSDDRLDGLFKLFDFFIDNDIRLNNNVSINDVRTGRKEKVVVILRALKGWEDKRKTTMRQFNRGVAQAGPFMALEPER